LSKPRHPVQIFVAQPVILHPDEPPGVGSCHLDGDVHSHLFYDHRRSDRTHRSISEGNREVAGASGCEGRVALFCTPAPSTVRWPGLVASCTHRARPLDVVEPQEASAARFKNSSQRTLISAARVISRTSRCNGDFSCPVGRPVDRVTMNPGLPQLRSPQILAESAASGTPHGAAADLARLDLNEQVPNSVGPWHRAGLPG
jgi:hypothetical protein